MDREKKSGAFFDNLQPYHFEIRHLLILFIVLIVFQLVISFVHRNTIHNFLTNTQNWYQQDAAERLANLTTTSLELLLESETSRGSLSGDEARTFIQDFNIIFSQLLLDQDVQDVCLLVEHGGSILAIDNGKVLHAFVFEHKIHPQTTLSHPQATQMYARLREEIRASEQIRTIVENEQTFHTFVPFVPRGEYVGAVYMKTAPDFAFITRGLILSFNQTTATYLALILFGLLAMFYISSYTVKARNQTQQLLFEKEKERLSEHINYQKELMFTKRIYHTHHKAEKVMGFIKEDLRAMTGENIEEVKNRVTKYSNFIARVIYDMKWYDPPVQTIRSPLFKTDVNQVLRFLVENIFQRVSSSPEHTTFRMTLDENIPSVPVNEFVIWEAFEPIIQNCVEHAGVPEVVVSITTRYDCEKNKTTVIVGDNGVGVRPDLLEMNELGIRQIFRESVSSKTLSYQHSGYGCYVAHEIATQRCGWEFDVENLPTGGCQFVFTISHQEEKAHNG